LLRQIDMSQTHDTIAAIATAPGTAGLAVVRVSGAGAFTVADRVFRGGAPLDSAASHTLHHGWAAWPGEGGERLDEVVAAVFRAPKSYTREHVVELSCHGGRLTAERVLEALLEAGARLANPGEFTLRAFLGGRIDLAQAEGVADLIHAETEGARELAVQQLAGGLSRRIDALADRLADAVAEVEARVDFAEDVGGVEVPPHVVEAIAQVDRDLADLLAGAAFWRAVREGVRLPIVGRANVGKSSLFNAMVGEARAIVTDRPGTTRDRVSEAIEIAGIRVTLSDTAGLRESDEPVEAIGIARARDALREATLVLWVVDGAAPLEDGDRSIAEALEARRTLVAINKRDAGAVTTAADMGALLSDRPHEIVEVSAVTGEGLDALRARLARMMGAGPVALFTHTRAGRGVRATPVAAGDRGGAALDEEAASALASAPLRRVASAGAEWSVPGAPEPTAGGVADAAPGPRRSAPALAAAVANPRHAEALGRARAALARAAAVARDGLPGELVALELREGLAAIGEVTGREVGEDLLDRIFSRFCIGK
jgi:tRNA modification GTPase